MAELIPINCPFVFIKAPPLFPIFTAASVCINDSTAPARLPVLSLFNPKLLPLALMMPAVTVVSKVSG